MKFKVLKKKKSVAYQAIPELTAAKILHTKHSLRKTVTDAFAGFPQKRSQECKCGECHGSEKGGQSRSCSLTNAGHS